MDSKKIVKELQLKYPGKNIVLDPPENPTEIICEINPTSNHPEKSIALAIVGKSKPHYHRRSTEIYEVLKGTLIVYRNGKRHVLKAGEKIVVKPGIVHYAEGNDVWFLTHSTPGWIFTDHVVETDITVTRPERKDRDELLELFNITITGAFISDGIENLSEDITYEIEMQMKCLDSDFNSGGKEAFYLVAKADGKIAGAIAAGTPNPRITKNLHLDYTHLPEIKSVYILPEFQLHGIGSKLFAAILNYLKEQNVNKFVLEAGYKKSQPFWIKKLGPPTLTLKNFWGEGFNHLIWHMRVNEVK